MDSLERYRVFVQVAEMGSFIKAAHALELPRASVSAAVQALESDLGTRLLHRTTRQVTLTAEGAQLLDRVRPLLAEAEDVRQLFQRSDRQLSGRLHVDVPSRIARRLIVPALPSLRRRYPGMNLELGSTDRAIDLVREGVDCVVRVGQPADSRLVARPLGHVALANCASPAYLREHGTPMTPTDLAQGHHAIGFADEGHEPSFTWHDGKDERQVTLGGWLAVNNAENYIAACVAGLGLIQIPRFDVRHLLEAGTLVEVLPAFLASPMPVSILYAHRRQRSRLLVAFVDWFEALMQPHLVA